MANPEHVAKLKEGTTAWNLWRLDQYKGKPDLSDAALSSAELAGANLVDTNLEKADLNDANLVDANLLRGNLAGASLANAKLRQANFYHANLSRADLHSVDIRGANLTAAILADTNFTNAAVGFMNFGYNDLRTVKGLETCTHFGPSYIDVHTLLKSGPLPHAFLRGCGVPDSFIAYLPSLLNQPIQFYSCFISYSTKDEAFANRLYADLQSKGVRCWYAPHDMRGGRYLHDQVDEAIRLHERLLLILSDQSIQSDWVKTETLKARRRELAEGRQVLFPIRLTAYETLKRWEVIDPQTGEDVAHEVRKYFIPDFSNWKDHDSFQVSFDRLLQDLKGVAPKVVV